jgi:ligand-binding sensor domain-containing protein/serine phosphatase RsbU (regulator of sigma subunit)
MNLYKRTIQLLIFLFPVLLNSQTYPFTNYGVQDGLAQSNVAAILQDGKGYFWMATESGVSRFDGKNFITYTTEDGLANNNVSALLLDAKGNVWMGHENGMLTKYDGKTFKAITSEALPKDKKIYSLYEGKKGKIWICTAQFGAIVLDPEKSTYKTYTSKEGLSQYVFSSFEDKSGNMYFLTDVGVKYLSASSNKIEFFRPEGMPAGQITSFIKVDEGDFLIGMVNGLLYSYNADKKQFTNLIDPKNIVQNSFVYTIHQDAQKNIWASVLNVGVYKYEPSTKRLVLFSTANGLAINKIKCIAEDREGNILLGTSGEGVQVFKGERFVSFTKKDGLINNQVWNICQDHTGKFWFGTNEGISVYDPKETIIEKAFKNISIIDGIQSKSVRSICADKDQNLWIGTWGGKVAKFDIGKNKFEAVPSLNESVNDFVNCLMIDKKNKLWVGTINGIATYDINSGIVKHIRTIDGLSDNDVTSLFQDSKGNIWIGTKQKGISLFNGSTYKLLNAEQGLTFNSITSIAEDKKGNVWVGTEGGGAFVYDGSKFKKYKTADGLISDFVTLIAVDEKDMVWLGTNKGLSKFESATNTFLSYSKNDGFTGIETKLEASYRDNEGNLWFGTVNGVFKYDPNYDKPVLIEPALQFTGLKINDKETELATDPELSYKDNSLRFDFIGISLSNPDEVKYLIKLEGYDENWKAPTKQNFETYSNLHAGHYTFQVKACNSAGVCSKEPMSFSFFIPPPFWKTWWFYVLITLSGLIIVFAYIKIRERSLIIEKKILEEKVRERTAEVVEKNIELDEKNKDITASIRYAKRIQDAILPPDDYVKKYLPKTFILFKPKDIVSGDFYWVQDKKDRILFAAVDCTGHGVPGAFMSIVGHNAIDQIVVEQNLTKPSDILDALNKSVSDTLRQSNSEDNSIRDGMDLSLCSFDRRTNVMEYAGAFNPFWMIRNGEFTEIKGDKFPIGNLKKGENKKFTNHSILLQTGDTIYVFSDGFADQFGGPNGKKYKYNTFKNLLLEIQHLSMEEQGEVLNRTIEDWRGNLEQVDDILIIGTRL